ncbi:hypothetical protein GCM10010174_30610 [Kutzneria viridogrisea]|uniref:Asp23/Gls24 family envelope stress response protein n=2 Tax=Kutzneria TaxID=43356 RepID=W5VYS4_9PSEU|nr:Asp23/Gls24 family envelope stress response protein [Kutzneria albida]AHH93595.1 hypothetical protein KALB_218 [Kutzneria albida DSM 43870]MBA8929020.1 putative alkaline shock family protein YloU [Kutzneria viridogrisea]
MTTALGGAVEVAEGVVVESRAIARLTATAARSVDGVVSLEPTLLGFVADLGRQLRDVITGRDVADPVDGIQVSAEPAAVRLGVALSVGGRPAREVSVEVSRTVRDNVQHNLGVRVDEVRVTVVDVALIPPEARVPQQQVAAVAP